MRLSLPFDRGVREIEVPDANVVKVLQARHGEALPDPHAAVTQALAAPIDCRPLADLARGHDEAVVVICDMTRPVPNRIILPPLLRTLEDAGIKRDKITILVATGLHRPNRGAELLAMVGKPIADGYRIVNHRARVVEEQASLGITRRGTPIQVDALYARAPLKITTGYIEPHLMAGFSGGRKVLGIGCGGERQIRALHGPAIIEHPNSIEGVIEGNILHEELTEITRRVGMDFIVNVTLDRKRRITGVFAGQFEAAWAQGCAFARQAVRDTVDAPCDIVVTSCGGFPQDCTYYQSAKGFTGAMHIAKPGGTIIMLSACAEGFGGAQFRELCRTIISPEQFARDFVEGGRCEIDQWAVHNFTRALRKCDGFLIDEGLTTEERGISLPRRAASFEEALDWALAKHGPTATIAVIPDGPNVLAQAEPHP
ncbi:MAG: nickel-dependent lactate racemase [Phycisphaerae bacterium]|nr:nickel-dependent lactate racemase [Phycisphaerae bacterium]